MSIGHTKQVKQSYHKKKPDKNNSKQNSITKIKIKKIYLWKNITWLSDKLPNSSAIEIDAADCKTFRPAMTPPLIVENSTYRRKKNQFKTGLPDWIF